MPTATSQTYRIGDIQMDSHVPVRMRDGVTLIADLYRPADTKGPLPTLLMRQPYGREIASTVVYPQPSWLARQGFLVMIQDVRGRGDSEGVFDPFVQEEQDGFDTLEWLIQHPFCNGSVGMYGFSYQAVTQMAALASGHTALKAMAPHQAAFDLYRGWFYRDGMLQLHTTLGWANQMTREDVSRKGAPSLYGELERLWKSGGELVRHLPLVDIPVFKDPACPRYPLEWLEHDTDDGYWEDRNYSACLESDIPMFHLAGWYDFYLRGSLMGYQQRPDALRSKDWLVAGPWVHIPWGTRHGAESWGEERGVDPDNMLVCFFKAHLAGEGEAPTGVDYFLTGENRWAHATDWPPPEAEWSSFFLGSQGRANSRFGDGFLNSDPESLSASHDTFVHDPEVPVLAPGGDPGGGLSWGAHDLSSGQQGNHLLVYTSKPFQKTTRLAGNPRLDLEVSSTGSMTTLVARLSRVSKDKAIFLGLGALQVDTCGDPSRVYHVQIQLDGMATTFKAGDCIRLDIASTAWPLLSLPAQKGHPHRVGRPIDFGKSLVFIHYPSHQRSVLQLPILP